MLIRPCKTRIERQILPTKNDKKLYSLVNLALKIT